VQFLNPRILVRKGGKVPDGHINDWFFLDGDLEGHIKKRFPEGQASLRYTRVPVIADNLAAQPNMSSSMCETILADS
jgi:hypothetical protein